MSNEQMGIPIGDEDVPDFVKEAEAKEKSKAQPKKKETVDKDEPVDLTPKQKSDKSTAVVIRNEAMEAFMRSANNIMNVTGLVDTAEAKRLIFSALTKAETVLQDKGITFQQIYQQKFISAIVNAALLGLDAELGEVYIIPYQERSGKYTLNVQRGYKGERKLRMKFAINKSKDEIVDIDAFLVRQGDTLKVTKKAGTDAFEFEQADVFSTKPITGSLGYVLYESGKLKITTMTKADLDKRMEASKAKMGGKTSPAWKLWADEMYLGKTIGAACKQIPVEFKDDALKDAYAKTDYETAEYEVLDTKPKISLNAGSME